jgi:hypothetical protein
MKQQFYWQDWVTTVLGLWIALSPLIIPVLFPASAGLTPLVEGNAFVVGVAIVVLAWLAITTLQGWEEWVDGALGLWLAVSPFVLAYTYATAFTWNAVVSGAAVVLVSIWSRYARPDIAG